PRPPDLPPRKGPGRRAKLIYEMNGEVSLPSGRAVKEELTIRRAEPEPSASGREGRNGDMLRAPAQTAPRPPQPARAAGGSGGRSSGHRRRSDATRRTPPATPWPSDRRAPAMPRPGAGRACLVSTSCVIHLVVASTPGIARAPSPHAKTLRQVQPHHR